MPRKGENIYKRKDGRWEARYIAGRTSEKKAIYKSVYGKTYSEVKQKLFEFRNANMPTVHSISPKFGEIAQGWLDNTRPRVKESTYSRYQRIIFVNLSQYLKCPLETLTTREMETFINTLLLHGRRDGTGGLAPKTVHDILVVIRSILTYAKRRNYKIVCDLSLIKINTKQQEIKILSKQEQNLLNHFLFYNMNYEKLGIVLCLYTGLRIGEVCALQWKNINFTENTLTVESTLQRIQNPDSGSVTKTKIIISEPKSKSSLREIPLPDFLMKILDTMKCSPDSFILTGSKKRFLEPRNMQYYFSKALKICQIAPINFHALRHTFATRSIELGFEVKSLSEILGHTNINITLEKYVHSSFELKKENMEKLSSLL